MKIKRILSSALVAALAVGTMAISASAANNKLVSTTGDDGKNGAFQLASEASKKDGTKMHVGTNKVITDYFEIAIADVEKIASVKMEVSYDDKNVSDDKPGGWANGQFYASGTSWESKHVNATDVEGDSFVVELPFTPDLTEDGAGVIYAVGAEEYGGGSYTFNAIKFLDKDGNVVTQYPGEGAKAPEKTDDTNTPATDDSSNKGKGDEASAPTGIESVAAVAAIALIAGGALVASRKRK